MVIFSIEKTDDKPEEQTGWAIKNYIPEAKLGGNRPNYQEINNGRSLFTRDQDFFPL